MAPRLATLTTITALGAAAAASVGRLLDGVGTRHSDREAVLPGDDLHGPDALVRTRAVTIAAPRADVWPWLVQLGWGRAGWYSIDLLERPLGAAHSVDAEGRESWRSLTEVVPAHQDLAVGDTIPLTAEHGFEVVRLAPEEHLVAVFGGGGLRMVWALVLRDRGAATRLVVRTAFEGETAAVRVATRLLVDPGHAVMELVQLRGIRRRAEGYLDAEATVR